MNCPNCPSPLVCPEGGQAYCPECGWGRTQKRVGELIDAILTHRRDTSPGASAADRKLWATVVDPVPYGLGEHTDG